MNLNITLIHLRSKNIKNHRKFYSEVRKLIKDESWIIDHSDIFLREQMIGNYFDDVHLGPNANKLIAKEIYKYIVD